jgi:hypothetical protein
MTKDKAELTTELMMDAFNVLIYGKPARYVEIDGVIIDLQNTSRNDLLMLIRAYKRWEKRQHG